MAGRIDGTDGYRLDLGLYDMTTPDAARSLGTGGRHKAVSLFSGAMGFDIGMMLAGVDVAVSQDVDRWCVETIRRNGHVGVLGDIRALLDGDPACRFLLDPAGIAPGEEVFAVIGGPPCQSFSTAGKRRGVKDERGSLWESYAGVVAAIRPRFFVMENVKGLASMSSDPDDPAAPPLIEVILGRFRRMGYSTVHGVLDAVHYGTPQFRERLVIVGSRDGEDVFLPRPTHFQRHQDPAHRWRTLGDALDGLADPGPGLRFAPNIRRFLEMVPEGGNWRSLPEDVVEEAMGGAFASGGGRVGFYRRLGRWEPSPTLVTSPVQKATVLCHPVETRPLSLREYARIQQFPDDWVLEGRLQDCYRQIGNAVPIPLGRAIGQMLVSVAEGRAVVRTKRTRGTSVHAEMLG
jgi:DNA (cytosine-5)-methyltransferase 1